MSQRNNTRSSAPTNQFNLVNRAVARVPDARAIAIIVLVLVLLIINGGAG